MGSDPWCTKDHFRWQTNFNIIYLEVTSGAHGVTPCSKISSFLKEFFFETAQKCLNAADYPALNLYF